MRTGVEHNLENSGYLIFCYQRGSGFTEIRREIASKPKWFLAGWGNVLRVLPGKFEGILEFPKNGFPDIFAFKSSRTVFIEVKAPNGKRSELQKYRIEQLTKEGFTAFFCDDLNQLNKYL